MPHDHDDLDGDAIRAGRRAQATAEAMARTGIDEAMITGLVHAFYDKIRADEVLGPVFAARISDWGPHLENMVRFWSSVALHTGTYHGRPMPKHAVLPVDGSHFDRWLALFEATAAERCPPAAAATFIEAARRIAQSLELGIAITRGMMLQPGERLPAA